MWGEWWIWGAVAVILAIGEVLLPGFVGLRGLQRQLPFGHRRLKLQHTHLGGAQRELCAQVIQPDHHLSRLNHPIPFGRLRDLDDAAANFI